MFRLANKTILVLIGLAPFVYAAYAAGPGSPRPLSPVVQSTTVDLKNNVMVITGRNFGSVSPVVRLANYALEVKGFSASQVVASLPPGIRPGTYSLTVAAYGPPKVSSDIFSTVLFAGD